MSSDHSSTRKSIKERSKLTGRRNRQETMLSIRKAKKEDAYATRRNLQANRIPFTSEDGAQHARDVASRKDLFENLAARSQSLLQGIQHKDMMTRQKAMRAFVYLLSSGVPPLFDESDSQHVGLWSTILSALPHFIAILQEPVQDDSAIHLHSDAAFALRFISSMDKAAAVIQTGAIPLLVSLFQSGISELQVQAAWALGNIASESPSSCEAVIQACPPRHVLPHVRMATPALRRASVWLLRSLVDSPEAVQSTQSLDSSTQEEILDVLSSILTQLTKEKVSAFLQARGESSLTFQVQQGMAKWRIFELKTGKPAPNDVAVVRFVRQVDAEQVEVMDVDVNFETGENSVFTVRKQDLRPMTVMDDGIEDEDEEDVSANEQLDEQMLTLCDGCWALVELSLQKNDVIPKLVAHGVPPRLVELLYISQSSVVLSPVLRLLGNIVSADVQYAQNVLEAHVLSVFPHVLTNTSRAVREEACWMLSNIAGGQVDQAQAVLNAPDVLSALMEQLSWAEYNVKREATWAVCNLMVKSSGQELEQIVSMGVLEAFVPLLDEWEDPSVEIVILEALENFVRTGGQDAKVKVEEDGCLEKLEELCYDENERVSELAVQLLETYFDGQTKESMDQNMDFKPVEGDVQFDFTQ